MKFTTYETINNFSNKSYFGVHRTNTLNDSYLGSGTHFKAVLNKHGPRNFQKLEVSWRSEDIMWLIESWIVDELWVTNNYNIALGGFGGPKHSKESRKKMSNSTLGRKASPETKLKMRNSRLGKSSGMAGKTHNPNTKSKMSKKHLGKTLSKTHKNKISLARQGIKFSNEHKENISKCHADFSGANGPTATRISIFNPKGEMVYQSLGKWDALVKKHKLPRAAFSNSYRSGKPIPVSKKKNQHFENLKKYFGWYAIQEAI